ncbi:MAG: hypothetical protein ACYC8T_33090 [Myxococcaceae bacterium]
MNSLLLSLVLAFSVQQQLEGAEVADGPLHLTFNPGGKYSAVKHDKGAGNSTAEGTWVVSGDALEVKVAECKGPACKEVGAPYKAEVTLVAERAMTVRTTPPEAPLASGSYYCRYQGCSRRYGVMVTTHGAKPLAVRYLVDFLIEKNRARDAKTHSERALAGSAWVEPTDGDKPSEQTAVWEAAEQLGEKQSGSSLTWCKRSEARGKKAAEQVAKDIRELPWMGQLTPTVSSDASCLWDVRLVVGDDVKVPPRK